MNAFAVGSRVFFYSSSGRLTGGIVESTSAMENVRKLKDSNPTGCRIFLFKSLLQEAKTGIVLDIRTNELILHFVNVPALKSQKARIKVSAIVGRGFKTKCYDSAEIRICEREARSDDRSEGIEWIPARQALGVAEGSRSVRVLKVIDWINLIQCICKKGRESNRRYEHVLTRGPSRQIPNIHNTSGNEVDKADCQQDMTKEVTGGKQKK
ncbi:hypothetical protein ARMGADRAFT_1031501 [Armillaria gallica]|uniref:Uncharacterized protein n=1 Tax=Armillaria gallica TaxID=47427 RepID=A0A2H3DKN2_ARMGA|nr:hypothetical protein ARMGADRAFT_1031501 [Armillaria gallica]